MGGLSLNRWQAMQDQQEIPATMTPAPQMAASPMIQHPMHAMIAPIGPPAPEIPQMMGPGGAISEAPAKMSPLDTEEQRLEQGMAKKPEGFMQKLGHGLGMAGRIAGDIFAPEETELLVKGLGKEGIGPRANEYREKGIEGIEAAKSKEGLEGAQAENQQSEADERGKPKPTQPKYQIEQTIDAQGNPIYAAINESDPTDVHPIPSLRVPPKEEKPAAPKSLEHVPILDDQGNKVEANYHPDAGTYTDAAGNIIKNPRPIPPPPSYGQLMLPTKTATFIDPNTGLPTEQQWDPKTGTYDRPLGLSASNAYGHEAAQAGAVNRAGTDLIQQLRDPSNREILGKLDSYIKQGTLGSPLADAQAARLSAELKTFAALQPAMHGFRSRSAQEAFERIVGGLAQNPDATIGSIQGILSTAGAINPGLQGGGSQPIVQQSPSTGQFRYSTDGGKTWQAGKPKGQ